MKTAIIRLSDGTEYAWKDYLNGIIDGRVLPFGGYTVCIKYDDGKELCVSRPAPELGTTKRKKTNDMLDFI